MDEKSRVQAVVLAAGKSTRFKTKKSKLLFGICGRSMIMYPMSVLNSLGIASTVVLGYQGDKIRKEIEAHVTSDVAFINQEEQRGTGHAVLQTVSTWQGDDILVLSGDTPLITQELIEQLIKEHKKNNNVITFLTTQVIDPTGYGRVLELDGFVKIIEDKNCTPEQKLVTRVNAGIYLFKRAFIEQYITQLQPNELTGEIYLVDLIEKASELELGVKTIPVPYDLVRGVNTLQDLWGVEQVKRSELIRYWMHEGVRFELAQSIHIDLDVTIGAGSFIGTGVHLLRGTRIGEECFVGAFSMVANTQLGDESMIHSHSVVQDSKLGSHVRVGPFARLREQVVLEDGAEVGNFVEAKQTTLGEKSKAKHLSYLGNAAIGKNVNIGAGTIFCNYDGYEKHTTTIQDDVFVGSNSTLVAPITIEKGGYTAAGSTINKDVPADTLAFGRARQENKEGYAQKLNKEKRTDNLCEEEETFDFTAAIRSAEDKKESII